MSADPSVRPSLLAGAGHLAALWALAFAQPLFDLLGRNPDFFVARGNTGADILVFAFAFALLPPAAMLGLEALAQRFGDRWRWSLHLGLVALLSAALALQVVKLALSRPGGLMIAAALALGAGAAYLYANGRFLRSLCDVLIPAPLVVLAVFLLFSESSRLVLPRAEADSADVEVENPAPLVFIILDELPLGSLLTPEGEIDASRFPAFAELARSATWYRSATAGADSTPRAVPAILTGRVPGDDQLPVDSDQPRNLFTLLGGSYEVRAIEQATRLCPSEICPDHDEQGQGERLGELFSDLRVVSEHLLLPDGLRRGLPSVDTTFGGFASEVGGTGPPRFAINDQLQLVAALHAGGTDETLFAEFVNRIDGRDRTLDFIHLYRPHYPWTHFPDGEVYSELQSELAAFFDDDGRFAAPREITDLALQRHLIEAGYADFLVGQAIRRLRSLGAWRRAMFVVVADHGGAFIPDEFRRVATERNIGQLAPIPLFVKAPGQTRGRVVGAHTCATDVLAFVMEELAIEDPWGTDDCPPRTVEVARVENSVLSGDGTEASLATVRRQMGAYTRRIARLFGTGTGWGPRVYALGPAAGLAGRPVASLPLAAGSGGVAEFGNPGRFTAGPTAETLLRGGIDGGAPGVPLAVAVNGRIVATGSSFEEGEQVRFSVLFPREALRPGVNVVELFEVHEGEAGPELVLLGSA